VAAAPSQSAVTAGAGGTLGLAVSPMWELVTSLRSLLRSPRHPIHGRWKSRVAPRLPQLQLAILPALVDAPILPHFLQPPPAPGSTFESELGMIAALSASEIATELGWAFGRRDDPAAGMPRVLLPLLTHPAAATEQLVAELRAYWTMALAGSWLRIEDFLFADVERTGKCVSFAAAPSMNPAYSFAGTELSVANMHFAPISVPRAANGWLIATVFSWPYDASIICNEVGIAWPDRAPMLPYAPKGLANVWGDNRLPASDALASVMSPARAKILTLLVRPTSTSEIASALAMTPGGASQQLALLHSAGLVERSREGHHVYYRLSRRGRHLLALFADDVD
jgi:DNA-binding transcriptional ArsR family regulator